MRKNLAMMILFIFIIVIGITPVSADRSFTIDQVTINAKIDDQGVMHVSELYTYTFSGSFQGVTRSIGSNVGQFKAFLVDESFENLTELPHNAEPLTVEKEDNTYKVYSESENETKYILYHYQVKDSVNKYLDIGEITYDFFDQANETDISNLTITLATPENVISNQTHAFLRADSGTLLTADHNIQYTNKFLKAGESTRIRLIFPAEELSGMEITKNKDMYDKILTAENDYLERLNHLEQKMNALTPIIWVFIAFLFIIVIFIYMIHPNRYRGRKNIDELLRLLEQTDPLLVSYLDMNEGVQDHSIIAALFSLRRRGIVRFEEVQSLIHEHINTYRFTWVNDRIKVDEADAYLRNWLFTNEDEKGHYFLLEAIIDNPDEEDSVREEKANKLRKHFDIWEGLVKGREEYQGLRASFRGYSVLSILLIVLSYGLFNYLTQIDPISPTEQLVLSIISSLLAFVSVIFSRKKWLLSTYYLFIIFSSLILFTKTFAVILAVIFFALSLFILLMVPAVYWKEDMKKIKYAMKKAYHLMATSRYPIGSETNEIERQLEYAIILGVGENFAEQCGKEERFHKLNVENSLLNDPIYVTDTFSTNNIVLYSTIHIGNDSFSSSSTSSTSSTGGGGAGAF